MPKMANVDLAPTGKGSKEIIKCNKASTHRKVANAYIIKWWKCSNTSLTVSTFFDTSVTRLLIIHLIDELRERERYFLIMRPSLKDDFLKL